MNTNNEYLNALADELGVIQNELRPLLEREKAIKAELKSAGAGSHVGAIYRANVIDRVTRESLDYKSIYADIVKNERISYQLQGYLERTYKKPERHTLAVTLTGVKQGV